MASSGNPVVWFEIYVADLERARAFYENVLGVTLERLDSHVAGLEMWTFPMQRDGTGAAGALARMQNGPSGGGTSTIVYFGCEDCAVEESRVAGHGGTVMQPKFSIGEHGFVSIVTDTEGNTVGLHSRR